MARVTINDLKNMDLTEDDIKHVTGGYLRIRTSLENKVQLGDGSVRTLSDPLLSFESTAIKIT